VIDSASRVAGVCGSRWIGDTLRMRSGLIVLGLDGAFAAGCGFHRAGIASDGGDSLAPTSPAAHLN
jgi:hypothetical protein